MDGLLIQRDTNNLESLEMNSLKDKVLKTIEEALCSRYIGDLDVIQNEDEYILKLYLNQRESPMYFSYQGSEQGFLANLKKDLRQRQIDRTKYFKGVQTDPGNEDIYITLE